MWRRIVEMILRRPSPPQDERSIKSEQLDELEAEVRDTNADARRLQRAARFRLDSYRRVRL